jgi:glycine cleavage system transcriptional repressor
MADAQYLILTAVGPDQVGLVEKISEFIVRHGCNIEDSKMAVFCGEFAVIILIAATPHALLELTSSCRELATETGLGISLKTPSSRPAAGSFLPYRLIASCMDHPGIVHRLSRVLSRHSVNIEAMETKTYAAPVSGTPIFCLEATVSIPVTTNINGLRDEFAEIQREENIDIELAPAKG